MRRLVITLALALVCGACASNTSKHTATSTTKETHAITGSFLLEGTEGEDFYDLGNLGCAGSDGYDDVETGLQVKVSNEAGTVIGNGSLDLGEVTDDGCKFSFIVNNIPVAKFYKIEVGRRGELNYSYDEMKAAGWNVELSLG